MCTFVSFSAEKVPDHNLQKVIVVLLFELLLFYVLFWRFDSLVEPCQGLVHVQDTT